MMLTILGLPPSTKYKDLKVLIKTRCNLTDFILDDLVTDTNGLKKVRIGLADGNEGAHLMKCLAGYRMSGCVLSVTPVGKGTMPGSQQNFEPKPNFNQAHNDYQGNDYSDSRPNPWGQQPTHQSQWGQNNMTQQPQNTFGYQQQQQQGMPMQNNQYMGAQQHQNQSHQQFSHREQFQPVRQQNQGYGFQQKTNIPEQAPQRSHVLRTVEIVDTPLTRPAVQPNRYPNQSFQADKSMTIMKDNFQGPSQYNAQGSGPPTHSQPWMDQSKPGFSKPNQPFDKPVFEPKRPAMKSHNSDTGYKNYDRDSPRRELRKSPFRKTSPRRSPVRSPRRASPGRRPSPARRSPPRRELDRRSPGRTAEGNSRVWGGRSPERRPDPGSSRYSPSRRLAEKADEFIDRVGSKPVRPAYEPPSQAANQPMYAGGYRANVHEKAPYTEKESPWQQERDKAMFHETLKKREEERSMSFQRPGHRPDKDKRSHSPRKSRSPVRRDSSPGRERFKRHSPSPRSPRRSWALEKRRSPELVEPPPPPVWPGQLGQLGQPGGDAWGYGKGARRPEPVRVRRDLGPAQPERREELDFKRDDRFAGPKFNPSDDFDKKLPKFSPRDEYDKKAPKLTPREEFDVKKVIKFNIRDDFDKKGPKFNLRDDFDKNGPKFSPRDDFDKKGPKFTSRDDFDKKGPKFNPRDDFDKKGPKFSPRDDFDKKGPKFSPRDDFDKKGPKFSPRDDFDKKGPKFSPRDDFDKAPVFGARDDYDDKRPKFAPRDDYVKTVKGPKFSPRDDYQEPKFGRDDLRKDPKFGHEIDRPKFSPRDDYDDRRDDFRKHDLDRRWDMSKQPDREGYRDQFTAKQEPSRMDVRRDVLRKMSEELDKQFEDVHKRAQDFHKRAEEYRREDRRRDFEHREPEPKYDDRLNHRDDDRRDRYDDRRVEDWNTEEHMKNKAVMIAAIKAKKEKAVEEITQKILDKHDIDAEAEHNARVVLELKIAVNRAINEMFGDSDVSFIELVVKFNAKYSGAGEDKILRDVLSSFPSQFRPKKTVPDYSEVPAKTSRLSADDMNKGAITINTTRVPEWDMTPAIPQVMGHALPQAMPQSMPQTMSQAMPQAMPHSYEMYQQQMNSMMAPMMVPTPYQPFQGQQSSPNNEGHNLYLCKDDFEPFSDLQADYLRKFLIGEIVKVTETSQWAPDFTFKGLQSSCRYELQTRDDASKDWLLNFDFSVFQFFNILVYTKEELWYERAAIWLPGHSRCRNIEPLTKLKLQNKRLDGANVGKWKFVKKVVTAKGTRVYVDMPPSSARALEKHKMSLSYELQKVNVFLKAVAVDKDAFDIGLKDPSLTDETELKKAALNCPMPSVPQDPKIIKICLSGNKPLTILQARKVREMLIYNIFKYQQQDGRSRTDFVKHGFVHPGYFGVLPENDDSKRWLMNLNLGKLNRQAVIILGADDSNTRYIDMYIMVPNEKMNMAMILERLKHSNQGVKGINFGKWKPRSMAVERFKYKFVVSIDVESVETIVKMNYTLDYVDDKNAMESVPVKYEKSEKHLLDLIKKYKAELHDIYDDSNMDLASSDSESDIVCLDDDDRRKTFSPGAWHKPVMRNETLREREYYPGPVKRQKMYYGYQDPERRPVPKPVQKISEPKPAATVVIEKRPVIFNPASKHVADYPPLPQRKPVQRPIKAGPQAQPVNTFEKQPKTVVGHQLTKAAGNQQTAKPVGTQQARPVGAQQAKPVLGNQQMKPVVENQQIKPVVGNQQIKPVVGNQQTKPVVGNQTKPVAGNQTKPVVGNQTKPIVGNQQTKPVVGNQTKPVAGNQTKPVVGNQTKPIVGNQQTKPVVGNQTKPVAGNQTKPVVGNQTKPVVGNQQTKPVAKQAMKPIEKQAQKPVQTTPTKPVVQKQTSQVVEKRQEIKPEPVEIAEVAAAPVEPCPEGYSQLNGLMSRALSEELQLVVDAISEELPKQAPTAAERFVLKKIQTDVVGDLRNALGLNVTKRLLNLHNPLYVKLVFSGKPEPGCLQPFIAKHKLCEFKRMESPGATFAARLESIADFDRLCDAKEVSCGSATVTVKPCYKFLACPPTLKTIYGTYTEPVKEDSNNPSKEKTSVIDNQKATQQEVASKFTEANQKVAITPDKVDEAPKDVQTVTIKQEVADEATESNNENVVVKQEVLETSSKTPDNYANTVPESPVKVNITIQGITKKDTVNASCKDTNDSADNKINEDDKSIKDVSEDTDVGDEEMNDKDILALMSGGIVLDECSGSEDDEK